MTLMLRCPRCRTRAIPLWREFVPRQKFNTCEHCGLKTRSSDWIGVVDLIAVNVLGLPVVFVFFILPLWQALLLLLGLFLVWGTILRLIFPPVALEEFASPADIRRLSIQFWLFAPCSLALMIFIGYRMFT